MGGGGSFSAGGPGKGMHSRLCKFFAFLLIVPSFFRDCLTSCNLNTSYYMCSSLLKIDISPSMHTI
jgi:hypothetical protein